MKDNALLVLEIIVKYQSIQYFKDNLPCFVFALTLEFDMFFENFNLANNFWIASSRALMFHMIISSDKTFFFTFYIFLPYDLDLLFFYFGLLFENITFSIIFSTVSARVFIFHMSISCEKIFLLVSKYLWNCFFFGGGGPFVFHKHILFFFSGSWKARARPLWDHCYLSHLYWDISMIWHMDPRWIGWEVSKK